MACQDDLVRFELSRDKVPLGFLTYLDGWSEPAFTRERGGEFDLDEIPNKGEQTDLARLIDESNEVPSGIPPAWRGNGDGKPPPDRTYKRGKDREWFKAFLRKLSDQGYVVREVED